MWNKNVKIMIHFVRTLIVHVFVRLRNLVSCIKEEMHK